MIKILDKYKCSGCKACYNVCPNNSIDMMVDEEGFWYPSVKKESCVRCGLCEKVCPEINIFNNESAFSSPYTLAAWNNNDNKRKDSSSGGVFTSIAEDILSIGGIVFGAGYDEKLNVIHKDTDCSDGLIEMMGSKYVQSDVKDSYRKAKYYLENNKDVLFSGTPCQIAGLYNYLQKEYNNLYTCDLVCHGVPSPRVFNEYKNMLEKLYNSTIQRIAFRHKKYGWKLYSVSVLFNNSTEYIKTLYEDPFILGFLRNYYLRPSCYVCTYAKLPRVGDITLGDFWGVKNKYPELDDDKGTSLLLVNTDKGRKILEKCNEEIYIHECELDYAIKNNPCIIKPVSEPKQRKKFFKDLNSKGFEYVVTKYMSPPSWIEKKIIFIRRGLGFVKKRVTILFSSLNNNEKSVKL